MPDQVDIRWLSNNHYAQLTLLDTQTGKPMIFCSKLRANPDGSFAFDVESPESGKRYRITARVEELLG